MKTNFLNLKTMKTIKFYAIPMLCLALLSSCSDDDDDNPQVINDQEVITTMTIELTPQGEGSIVTLQIRDLDGEGGEDPEITGGTLLANTTYNATIELLDETDLDDVEDITEEIEEEDDEHQFFFSTTGGIGSVEYLDFDDNQLPLGLSFSLATGGAASGTLTVTLRHEPTKDADGVADGDITNAGGETDIETTFDITVQQLL